MTCVTRCLPFKPCRRLSRGLGIKKLRNPDNRLQEVLLQRSDVETFLLSSLHHVRQQMEREQMLQQSAGAEGAQAATLPPLSGAPCFKKGFLGF